MSPLSQQIRIGTEYFTVIGILEKKGADLNGEDQDDAVIIPMETAMVRVTNSPYVNMIMMSIINNRYMEAAQKEAEIILREARRIPDGVSSDFNILNQSDMINMASATSNTLTSLLAAIAGISLLVGGIGGCPGSRLLPVQPLYFSPVSLKRYENTAIRTVSEEVFQTFRTPSCFCFRAHTGNRYQNGGRSPKT